MRSWLLSLVLIAGAAFGQSRSALETDTKGWKDILPSKSFKGWTRVPVPPTIPLLQKTQWLVDAKNKLLVCDAAKGLEAHEWLRFDTELADFIFHVEFKYDKLDDPKARYNSGIYARNNRDGSIWLQAQIGGGTGGYFFGVAPVNGENKRQNFQDKEKPSRVKPAGEWNTAEIRAQGNKLTLWVNGEITSEWPNLEVKSGYVGLEAEGFRIAFRNLKLKKL